MPSEIVKFQNYANECTRQALAADDEDRRKRLFALARAWTEEATAAGEQDKVDLVPPRP